MRFQASSLAWGLLAGAAQAQLLVNELSFGVGPRIAPERSRDVANFQLMGLPYKPEVLSNKIVLTPAAPAPGNQRGAIWGERPLDKDNWVADVDFRVSGPERGSGSLNIWLAKDGWHEVGVSTVYSAPKFQGLVLVLDTAGPSSAGSLRGYLNDGSKEFKSLTPAGLEALAFGHCNYAYRNLGRPSQIKIRQTSQTFAVEIDSQPCFASNDIVIPKGYRFGITASSADNPDSTELFKLVVTTDVEQQQQQQQEEEGEQQQQDQQQGQEGQQQQFGDGQVENAQQQQFNAVPDADADSITSSKAQFADLHNRLQTVNHHLSTIYRDVATASQVAEKRHGEMAVHFGKIKRLVSGLDHLEQLEDRLESKLEERLNRLDERLRVLDRLDHIEDKLEGLDRDMKSLHEELAQSLNHAHESLMYHVTGNLAGHHEKLAEQLKHPGHLRLILVIIGGQLCLGASYYIYKRRRANSPKKYL